MAYKIDFLNTECGSLVQLMSIQSHTFHTERHSFRRAWLLLVLLEVFLFPTPFAIAQPIPFATGLSGPGGITFDAEGNLFTPSFGLANGLGCVYKITPAGITSVYIDHIQASWALNEPWGITFDDLYNNLYVQNYGNGNLVKIDSHLNASTLTGGFDHGMDVVYYSSQLYVCESGAQQVTQVSLTGSKSAYTSGLSINCQGMTFDTFGVLYLTSFTQNIIYKVPINGGTPSSWAIVAQPSGITINPLDGMLYVACGFSENHNATVVKLNPADSTDVTISMIGFDQPMGIRVQSTGQIFVADYIDNTVFVYGVPGFPIISSVQCSMSESSFGNISIYFTNTINGAAPIMSCTAITSPGRLTAVTYGNAISPIILTGIPVGVFYTIGVYCNNTFGAGPSTFSGTVRIPVAPASPTINSVAAISGIQINIHFLIVDDGGSPVISCMAVASPGGKNMVASTSPITVTGLQRGTTYTFKVNCTNSIGTSPMSMASGPVSTWNVPSAPQIGTASVVNLTSVFVNYTTGSNNGAPILSCSVISSPGGVTISTSSLTSAIVTGLLPGISYRFNTYCTNFVGDSLLSALSNSVIPAAAPSISIINSVVAIAPPSAFVQVFYTAGAPNGQFISFCSATSSPGSYTGYSNGTSSPIVVHGLTQGINYTFTVNCTNTMGTSPASAPSAKVNTIGIPLAPSIVTPTVLSATSVSVAFMVNDGGSHILNCSAISSPASHTGTAIASPITVSSLIQGTFYSFTVACTNAIGTGAASTSSFPVLVAAVPSAPANVSVKLLSTSASLNLAAVAQVNFSIPSSNGLPLLNCTSFSSAETERSSSFIASVGLSQGPTATLIESSLIWGKLYNFTVRCANQLGAGLPSIINNVLIAAVPDPPTILLARATSANNVTLTFTPSAENGSPILYCTAESMPPDAVTIYANTNGAPIVVGVEQQMFVSGLLSDVRYMFVLRCTNVIGTSANSAKVTICRRCCGSAGVALRC